MNLDDKPALSTWGSGHLTGSYQIALKVLGYEQTWYSADAAATLLPAKSSERQNLNLGVQFTLFENWY
jgi:hypothetical protein